MNIITRYTLLLLLTLPTLGLTTLGAAAQTNDAPDVVEFSQAQLDAMLAPIALYPDTVLSHVLIASTYPLEVVEADRWVRNHPKLKGDDALNAVDNQDWDPSVKALVAFPDVLRRMSEDLDWTQSLGDAFLASEARVMDSIQNLRNRAYASGNLDKVDHVRVIREEKTIVIEPSVERVVYVPSYDTRVIYGNWWWPDYPPVFWTYPSNYVFVSGFYWGPRVYVGPRFYFSSCHWHDRRVVVIDRGHHYAGPRFYDGRSIARYQDARPWHHNPVHRRNVAYHDERMRARYHSPQESYDSSRRYRDSLRPDAGRSAHIAPNSARDQRQGIERSNNRDYRPQQADGLRMPNSDKRNERVIGATPRNAAPDYNEQARTNKFNQPQVDSRADQLRERLSAHNQGEGGARGDGSHITGNNRDNSRDSSPRKERQLPAIKSYNQSTERAGIPGRTATITEPRAPNVRSYEAPARQQESATRELRNYGTNRTIERTELQKVDRPQAVERQIQPQMRQQIETRTPEVRAVPERETTTNNNYNRGDSYRTNTTTNSNRDSGNRIERSGGGERIVRGGRER